MSERLPQTVSVDLSRPPGLNPDDLLDLRPPHPEPSALGGEAVAGSGA